MIDRPDTDAESSAGERTSIPRGHGDSRTPAGSPFTAADLTAQRSKLVKKPVAPASAANNNADALDVQENIFAIARRNLKQLPPRDKDPRMKSAGMNKGTPQNNCLEELSEQVKDRRSAIAASGNSSSSGSSDESSSSSEW